MTFSEFLIARIDENEGRFIARLREFEAGTVTLRKVAMIYSDHPDYRAEWAE